MKIQWSELYEFFETPPGPTPNWAIEELARELQRLKVPVDVRLLGVADAFPDGGWCIHQEDDVWLVYHSERGRRSGPAIFTSSIDAAKETLNNDRVERPAPDRDPAQTDAR